MAEQQIKIKKTIYSSQQINNVIDTSFSQFFRTRTDPPVTPDMSINTFFDKYNELFYDIPLSGSDQSHLGLATKSLDYLGVSLDDLQNEINFLREENVELKNQILLSTQINTGSLEEI